MSVDELLSIEKEKLHVEAEKLKLEDINLLVEWLSEKADDIRYQSLLLLKCRSEHQKDVYPYWDVFCEKLKSENSYQRSIGLMLIADNTKWDTEYKLEKVIDDYLNLLEDDKPITIRQCIQALYKILPYKPDLLPLISKRLMKMDLLIIKETMRKLILMDILQVLIEIKKTNQSVDIDAYISMAFTGEILDKKSKKQIEALL